MLSWGLFKKNVPWVQRCCPCKEAPVFWSVNWSAALLHLVNALATLLLWVTSENSDHVYKLTETAAQWTNITGTSNCTIVENGTETFQVSDEWCISRVSAVTSELSLWWLVIAFHFLSFIFQAVAMMQWKFVCCGHECLRENYVDEVEKQGTNVLRMLEYSVSATLMQIAIALVLGIWQRLVIIGIAFLTVITMLLGLIAEQLKHDRKDMAWVAHITGWVSFGGVWVILGRQFLYTVETSEQPPPDFVFIIVGVIAVLYSGFGIIQFVQLWLTTEQNSPALNRAIELAYCVSSLTSKTFLGWIIFANALGGMARS